MYLFGLGTVGIVAGMLIIILLYLIGIPVLLGYALVGAGSFTLAAGIKSLLDMK